MAKIKFNLNFGGEQIRTLDDLRDNFSIEDVLDVYNNGLLVKWLDVHNHKHELEQVNAIHATDARGILTELIKIFGISDDPAEIEESLSVLDYLEERKKVHEDMKAHGIPDYEKVKKERDELLKQNEELREMRDSITPEIEAPACTTQTEAPKPAKKSYDALVQEIINNHQDLNHIYDCLDAITIDYPDILREKHSTLFDILNTQKPLTLYALFGHHGTRPYYVLNNDELGINSYAAHQKIKFKRILDELSENTFLEKLPFIPVSYRVKAVHPYIKIHKAEHLFSSEQLGVWTPLEPAGKKFVLLFTYERDHGGLIAGKYTHHLPYKPNTPNIFDQLNGNSNDDKFNFPIFEGIDLKRDNVASYEWQSFGFFYMEARQ